MSWKFKNRNWSGSVVTISTVIFAIVSLISVYISLTTWQTQREAARPYFSFIESPSLKVSNEAYEFEFKFKNVGVHPATSLYSRTLVFEQNLSQRPILIDDYTVVNDIPRDTSTSLLLNLQDKDFYDKANINPHFIIIYLTYADPIVDKPYTQTIYLKWAGVIAGQPQPLLHVEMTEKENIVRYIENRGLLNNLN
ncbi:hypothetical protein Desor_4011 [Desulfosporosinus orientis DSM 765]|uniref:Uncharacterized protein n=1 Tax=Desulfosporosinus orientis (strain ATCC 19365 / DSM 765 / NCIMB 8382 / VKM B-1628 / Singapore I) TaxID=768706 RepID=G7WFT8_DESOD|nr:hypothetical protein [Desulfosporosinus orientis]AET69453.1 hypothetical protein Desor_4011 [Desulfosporosinus orientis DSM 765]